jgi:hypothetical protein
LPGNSKPAIGVGGRSSAGVAAPTAQSNPSKKTMSLPERSHRLKGGAFLAKASLFRLLEAPGGRAACAGRDWA